MLDLTNFFKLLEDRGVAAKISRATGISSGNISDWKSGRSKPTANSIIKIAEHLNYSVDYLITRTDIKDVITTKTTNIISIPILQQKAAAGLGIETNDYSDFVEEYKFFDKTQIPKEAQFGIIIEGDSMEPTFKNGQVIFVKKLDDCDHNDYGIFCITEYDTTIVVFKRKVLLGDGSYCLHSLNPEYEDIGGFNETKICRCIAKMVLRT